MEAFVLPFLALALVGALLFGLSQNRPAIEEDEVKALLPLLRVLHGSDNGLAQDSPALRPYVLEIERALERGYVRRADRGLLMLTVVGDRLRRTGKLTSVPASARPDR